MPAQAGVCAEPGEGAAAGVRQSEDGTHPGQPVDPGHAVRPGIQSLGGVRQCLGGRGWDRIRADHMVHRLAVEHVARGERPGTVVDRAFVVGDDVQPPRGRSGRGVGVKTGGLAEAVTQAPGLVDESAQDVEDERRTADERRAGHAATLSGATDVAAGARTRAAGDRGPAQAGTVGQVGVHTWTSDAASPSVRGTEYGRTFASALANAVRQYLALFASYGMTGAQARYHAETSASAVAAHAPELVEEVGTLARAAGLEEWQVWALNARTEILAAARSAASECSTAVHLPPDGGAPRTFQTWDWVPGVGDDLVAARYPTAAGIGVVTVAEAGQVAKFGVSTRGIGVHLNILNHVTDGGGGGVPVHVLARMLLERAGTLEEATAIARSVPVSASTVLTVVTAEPAAACLEISPVGVGVVRARPGTTVVHANHFLDPELAAGEAVPTDSTTWARMDCLTAHADLIALSPPVERARALGGLPQAPISVRPNPALPAYRRSETKLTLALDVAGTAVEYHPGAPADVTAEGWRRVEYVGSRHHAEASSSRS